MRAERCREWRHLLGAHALGQLSPDEQAGLEAHIEGCPECRRRAHRLASVARLLPLADPERFETAPGAAAVAGRPGRRQDRRGAPDGSAASLGLPHWTRRSGDGGHRHTRDRPLAGRRRTAAQPAHRVRRPPAGHGNHGDPEAPRLRHGDRDVCEWRAIGDALPGLPAGLDRHQASGRLVSISLGRGSRRGPDLCPGSFADPHDRRAGGEPHLCRTGEHRSDGLVHPT